MTGIYDDLKPEYAERNGIPIFRPNLEQFASFHQLMQYVDQFGQKSGVVKIIPPREWTESLRDVKSNLEKIEIKGAIIQEISRSGELPAGVFRQMNVENRRAYSAQEWFELAHSPEYAKPELNELGQLKNVLIPTRRKRQKIGDSSAEDLDDLEFLPADLTKSHRMGINFNPNDLKAPMDPQLCAELEKFYWKNLTYNAPQYGADFCGTLFDMDDPNEWNINHLDNLLNRLRKKIPGVNTAYLYFGMWKSTFAWHVEDMDLYSINYIHFGAPKQWYVVPPEHAKRFEMIASGLFSAEAKSCPNFLRHKLSVISPSVLASQQIPVYKVIQQPGEFMITYPHGYHSGFNYGFNCAESTNFALERWIDIGKQSQYCTCVSYSVKFNVIDLLEGSSQREFEEEDCQEVMSFTKNLPKRNIPKKQTFISSSMKTVKKVNGPKKVPVQPKVARVPQNGYYCCLCPDLERTADLLPTDQLGKYAHKVCAQSIPESSVVQHPQNLTQEYVTGLESIPKERFNMLKCDICKKTPKTTYTKGACIQCFRGKCVRAFHVTCALEAGIYIQEDAEQNLGICFCPQHDPMKDEQKRKEKEAELHAFALANFTSGKEISAKLQGSWISGVVEELLEDQCACLVDFGEAGNDVVLWSCIRLPEAKVMPADLITSQIVFY